MTIVWVNSILDCTGPRMTSMRDTRNPSTLFCQNQKYGCDQIWLRSNMVHSNMVTLELEHRTLKEWLRTHSPRVEYP